MISASPVIVLASSECGISWVRALVVSNFKTDYKISICCFSAKYAALSCTWKINVRETRRCNQEWTIQRHQLATLANKTQDEDKQNTKTQHRKLNRESTRTPPKNRRWNIGWFGLSICVLVERNVYTWTFVSVSYHYKNPTKRVYLVQSGHHQLTDI